MKRGPKTVGFNLGMAAAVLFLEKRGQSRVQSIAVAEEVMRARYHNFPLTINRGTLVRTITRIQSGEANEVKFPPDFYLSLLAASHPKSESRQAEASDALSKMKKGLASHKKEISAKIAEKEKAGKTIH